MKLNPKTVLIDIQTGEELLDAPLPIVCPECKHVIVNGGKPVTVGQVLVRSLLSHVEKDDNKVIKFVLAVRILQAEYEVILESEEVTLLKKLVDNMYETIVVGQIYNILEEK